MSHLPPAEHGVLPLTPRQREILCLILKARETLGRAPSGRWVAWKLGLSHYAVQQHLLAIYRRGWLTTPTTDGVKCGHPPA